MSRDVVTAMLEAIGLSLMDVCPCGKALKRETDPYCERCADLELARLFPEENDDDRC